MSMRDYAVDDYGLVFNSNHLEVLAAKLFDDYTEQDYSEHKYEYIEGLVDELGLEYISEFTGEAMYVNDDGTSRWDDVNCFSADSIIYLGLSNCSTLFKAAYSNVDEVINEFKTKVGKYLPNNFQYRSCLRHIVGTYYG